MIADMSNPASSSSTENRLLRAGLIGESIQLSLSPALHTREAAELGIALDYALIDAHERGRKPTILSDLLDEAESQGFVGVNITHPFKQAVQAHLHDLSPDAAMLGAVNTVVFRDGRRMGHNTDWYGFFENFRHGLPEIAAAATESTALLLGAGGAGTAVAHAAMKLGFSRLLIADVEPARAEALAQALSARLAGQEATAVADVGSAMRAADGLIHATPMGMPAWPGLPIREDWLESRHWVADIVYMPLVTPLLALAREKGCRSLGGGGMTVFQAAMAFELFTGSRADAARMARHFDELARAREG